MLMHSQHKSVLHFFIVLALPSEAHYDFTAKLFYLKS